MSNCTGPDYRPAQSGNALSTVVAPRGGLIAPDRLELGIGVTADSEVVGADGRVVKGLYYIGPWLRARDWEKLTAVPELREHARRASPNDSPAQNSGFTRASGLRNPTGGGSPGQVAFR